MLVRNLRAEAVHVIVIAVNPDDLGAIHLCAQNLCWLKIGGNEDAGFKTGTRGLRRNGIGKIAGRRAADDIEAEVSGLGESHCDYAVFKAERREAYSIVFQVQRPATHALTQLGCLQQRSESSRR